MNEESSLPSPTTLSRARTLPASCPACAGPNGCRLEAGEAYKGPCWCEEVTLPDSALRRLRDELPEPRCLCRGCLTLLAAHPDAAWQELAALGGMPLGVTREATVGEGTTFGADGALSRAFLLKRGACCQNGCKNCPYGFDAGRRLQPTSGDGGPRR